MGTANSKQIHGSGIVGDHAVRQNVPENAATPQFDTLLNPTDRKELEYTNKECQNKAREPENDSLQEPFRSEVEWTEEYYNKLIKEIQSDIGIIPSALLLGPTCAGKSSYINSIHSIDKGFITQKVYAASSTEPSTTTQFKRLRGHSQLTNFRLCDTMGVHQGGQGLNIEDVDGLIEGHFPVSHKFNPISPLELNDPHYKKEVTEHDKCQCVIFVLDSTNLYNATINDEVKNKIKKMCENVKCRDVPRLMILTKIDDLSINVSKDIRNTFKSDKVYKAVKAASELFGMPLANVHPVKNFNTELEVDKLKCIPLLLPIRQMVQFAASKFELDDY